MGTVAKSNVKRKSDTFDWETGEGAYTRVQKARLLKGKKVEDVHRIDWHLLGTPDKNEAKKYLGLLGEKLEQKIGLSSVVMVRILFYNWRTACQPESSGANYCITSHKHLAEKCGMSTRTVKRYLNKLRDLGLVTWRQQGGKPGEAWRPNIYLVGPKIRAALHTYLYKSGGTKSPTKTGPKKSPINSHRTEVAHDNFLLKKEYKATPYMKRGSSIYKPETELRARLSSGLTASSASAPSGEEERKASWGQGGEGKKKYEPTPEQEARWQELRAKALAGLAK